MTKTQTGVVKAAGFMMLTTIIARVLGFVRDAVILAYFGQNSVTDAYNAAFSIPDFLYMIVVGGALSSALIPVFSSYIATDQDDDAWRMASVVTNIVLVLLLFGISIGVIFTPSLVYLLVPKLSPDAIVLTGKLTRIMFIQTFFMALNGIQMGILNSYKHFTAPAIGGILYNLMTVLVGTVLYKINPAYGIMGFSIGVVSGAVVNFLICIPPLLKVGFRYNFSFNLRHPGVKKVMILMAPVLIGLSVTHFNLFVTQNLASGLPEGMITALRTGQRLMQIPIGVFAIAVAMAVFPTMTEQAALNQMEDFKSSMSLGVRTVIFITLPSAVGLIALRVPLIQLIFQRQMFTYEDTLVTAQALLYFSLGLVGYSVQQVLNRVFYAIHDSKTPVVAGSAAIFFNILLSFLLVKPMGHRGLALAYSVTGILSMLLLLVMLRPRLGRIGGKRMLISFSLTLVASLIMGLAVSLLVSWLPGMLHFSPTVSLLITVMAGLVVGCLVFGGISLFLKMEEAEMVKDLFLRRFLGRRSA